MFLFIGFSGGGWWCLGVVEEQNSLILNDLVEHLWSEGTEHRAGEGGRLGITKLVKTKPTDSALSWRESA